MKCIIGQELKPGSVVAYSVSGLWARLDVNIGLVLEVDDDRLKVIRFARNELGEWAATKRPHVIYRIDRVVTVAQVVDETLKRALVGRWAEYYQG